MQKRRRFLKKLIEVVTCTGLLFSPLFAWVQRVYAEILKEILPKEYSRENLRYRNPAELDTHQLEVTVLDDFKIMGLSDHQINIDTWSLEITGKIESPLRLNYSQILALPALERNVLMICPGIFVNHGRWKGISMHDLLKKVKVTEEASFVTFKGPEGKYEKTERFPIKDVLSNTVFLAYQVNGEPLPQKHGFPLRTVAEGHFGFAWVKYVDKISVD